MNNGKTGAVFLIGAGPGDPDLITVKGKLLLETCDVVVYDNLVPDELVVSLPYGREKYYVGKRAGKHCYSQEDINHLLLKLALEGKNVARLKGSDPLVFGRGGEEAKFLKKNGIKFEIVPGLTSGIAGPEYAGIPPTDRELSSFVLLVTGHKAREKEASNVPWDWVARAKGGTIAVYMGVTEINRIVSTLLESGMNPETPAAVIERATYPSQRILTASLKTLPFVVIENKIKPPALFVFGETIRLQPVVEWLSHKPLLGLRVMITRAADQSQEMYRNFRWLGAEVLTYPTIATVPFHDRAAWQSLSEIRSATKWLAFTSSSGVRNFIGQFTEYFSDIRRLAEYRIAALGSGTARVLNRYSLRPDFIPSRSVVSEFAAQLGAAIGDVDATVIRVRGERSDKTLEEILTGKNIPALPLTVYRTLFTEWPDDFKDKLFEFPPSVIIFTSETTVDGILKNLTTEEFTQLARQATIVSMGQATAARLRQMGIKIALEPRGQSIQSLIDELSRHLKSER
ncbi:MAG: uroporphyrinogen-III C-methyltransferase [bacterium]|jgi:uroporphyrinogen III methyltransferase/synthase